MTDNTTTGFLPILVTHTQTHTTMNPGFNDHPPLMSEYYPVGVISQFVTEQGGQVEKVKTRRRRRKGKGGGESEGGLMMRKRKLSDEQLSLLERSFGDEHKLETERKDQLAAELGLDPRQVAVWFQNRRARWKTKKLEEEFSKFRSHHESTVLEKCRLQTEVLKMKEQLEEAKKEIQRLSERGERVRSNSPSSSLSTGTDNVAPHFGSHEFAMEYLGDVFAWDDHVYYM